MIKSAEIQQKARTIGVRDQQIEKDYILSWILQGIAQHEKLAKALVFKGGTVLKKVYFEDYRFSEDLDFTLVESQLSNDQIFDWFKETFQFIKEEANIPLEIIDHHEHQDQGINFHISYIGPLGGQGSHKQVKIDISRSEQLVCKPVLKKVFLSYSDQEPHQLLCYPLEEILVEKMRCIIQRLQARDFYDIWYLLEVHGMELDFYLPEFVSKCESKGLNASSFHPKLEQRIPQYKGRWQKSMGDQIQDLPDFGQVLREVMRHLKKVNL